MTRNAEPNKATKDMNDKRMAAVLMAVALAFSAFSQTSQSEAAEHTADRHRVVTNRFRNNWFVSAGAGAQVYFGDHDGQCNLGDRLAPNLDVAVGKWFTPGLGLRFMYSGLQVKGATQNGSFSDGEPVPDKGGWGYWLQKQKFNMGNFHLEALFNLNNLFCGYREGRVWNISPYVGLGWAQVWDYPKQHEVSANVGVVNSFRLCKALNLNLDIRGMFVNDRFDGEGGGRYGEGMLSASLGLTYKLKRRGWDKPRATATPDHSAQDELQRRLAELAAENERLRKIQAEGGKQEVHQVKTVAAANLVVFAIGKSTLSREARANLGLMAEAIKQADATAVYTITGYADAGTGSRATNERLSQQRAQAVYDCLTREFGVNPSQLRTEHKGGVENMFYDDARLSRAVITRGK